jgi:hypothetical protein
LPRNDDSQLRNPTIFNHASTHHESLCHAAAERLSSTSRAMTTPTSRRVPMIFRNYNPNPAFNARSRW